MGKLFGTDGIRGVANKDPMTPETALKIGQAVAGVCKTDEERRHCIVVGNDSRRSGAMLQSALTAGICSMGVDVRLAGILPTPAIAYLTRSLKMDAGIMISASHNPFEDNGFKIFSRNGFKLPDAVEEEIERRLISAPKRDPKPQGSLVGTVRYMDEAEERYMAFCKNTFPEDSSLKGMKLVLDCANGATYRTAPAVFQSLGAEVTPIHCDPDGTNINEGCGSQHTHNLAEKVRELRADCGLAFDGDGDRLIAVDESGRELSGDHILAICGGMYKDRGWLKNNLIVLTVMSNFGFRKALEAVGIDYRVASVGDRYVMEMMQVSDAILGGENSGHIIFRNHHTSGDGIVSALQLLATVHYCGRSLSELSKIIQLYPQKMINVTVSSKPPLASLDELQAAIRSAESELGKSGRVLIRYSGTQSMCRVMVEAPTEEMANHLAETLADTVRSCVG